MVFGELLALYPFDTQQRGVLWWCQCNCGRFAVRYAAELMGSRRDHRKPCCSECLAELRRGQRLQRRRDAGVFWTEFFRAHGSLYTAADEEWPEASAVTAVAPIKLAVDPSHDAGGRSFGTPHWFRIIQIPDGWWECGACGKPFSAGIGCLACVVPLCSPDCRERHRRIGSEHTFDEIGESLGVTGARAGQIAARALRKLRSRIARFGEYF